MWSSSALRFDASSPECHQNGRERSHDTLRFGAAVAWGGRRRHVTSISGPSSLAVAASVRHRDTDYDELLMLGHDRFDARGQVHDRVNEILNDWRQA